MCEQDWSRFWVLGPGTVDLRLGIHSGAVTTGVLRGDNLDSSYLATQCSESDGEQFIAESHTTVELLMSNGKAEWLVARSRKVEATGKGTALQTYWLRHSS